MVSVPINKVAQEQEVGVWDSASDPEKLYHIVELAMDGKQSKEREGRNKKEGNPMHTHERRRQLSGGSAN